MPARPSSSRYPRSRTSSGFGPVRRLGADRGEENLAHVEGTVAQMLPDLFHAALNETGRGCVGEVSLELAAETRVARVEVAGKGWSPALWTMRRRVTQLCGGALSQAGCGDGARWTNDVSQDSSSRIANTSRDRSSLGSRR